MLFIILILLLTSSLFSGSVISDQFVETTTAPSQSRGVRGLYTIDLNTTTPYPHQNVTIYGPALGDNAGSSIATGDIDNDGNDDIIIGAQRGDGIDDAKQDSGEVYVYHPPSGHQ